MKKSSNFPIISFLLLAVAVALGYYAYQKNLEPPPPPPARAAVPGAPVPATDLELPQPGTEVNGVPTEDVPPEPAVTDEAE